MKDKYTIDELRNINDNELFEISKALVENKVQFSDDKLQIIYDKMNLHLQVLKNLYEFYTMSNLADHIVLREEFIALKEVYMAETNDGWPACKSALEVFFEWMGDEDLLKYDLGLWDYQHLLRWFSMLTMTELCDAPEDSTFYIFSCLVNEQIINRMPKHLKPRLWLGVQKFFPELAALFDNTKIVNEDGMKCVDLSEVAKALQISKDDVIKAFEGSRPDEYLISKDKVIKIQ